MSRMRVRGVLCVNWSVKEGRRDCRRRPTSAMAGAPGPCSPITHSRDLVGVGVCVCGGGGWVGGAQAHGEAAAAGSSQRRAAHSRGADCRPAGVHSLTSRPLSSLKNSRSGLRRDSQPLPACPYPTYPPIPPPPPNTHTHTHTHTPEHGLGQLGVTVGAVVAAALHARDGPRGQPLHVDVGVGHGVQPRPHLGGWGGGRAQRGGVWAHGGAEAAGKAAAATAPGLRRRCPGHRHTPPAPASLLPTQRAPTLVHQQLLQHLQLGQPVGGVAVARHQVQRGALQPRGVPHAVPLPAQPGGGGGGGRGRQRETGLKRGIERWGSAGRSARPTPPAGLAATQRVSGCTECWHKALKCVPC
jgi:hypothetical protein